MSHICKDPSCSNCSDPLHDEVIQLREQNRSLLENVGELVENSRKLTGYDDIDEFLKDCLDTMKKKGHDYRQGNDDDVLHNFRSVAESVGIDMEKVWFTYFYKHYSALATFVKEGGQQESEPIEGRVKDMIVYLLLFYRMIQESKKKRVSHLGEIAKRAEAADANYKRLKKIKEQNLIDNLEFAEKYSKKRLDEEHRHEPPF